MNGITFDGVHSYTNLNLILSSVNIPPAQPKMTFVDIPGADGSLDLSEANGEIKYEDRKSTFVFTTLPTDDIIAKQKQVSNALNGVRFNKITLDKDNNYYWTGRCYVDSYSEDYPISKITVKAVLNPWKRKQNATTVTDSTLTTSYKNITLTNSRKPVVPTITVSQETTVKFGTYEATISAGTHNLLNIVLVSGNNVLQAKTTSGTGTITITYQEGDL